MQEIKLKIKRNHFFVLERLVALARMADEPQRSDRAHHSIIAAVYKRIVSKAIDYSRSPNAKPSSFKLAYHEADALERILRANRGYYHATSYEYNAILTIADELDQKLQ